MSEENNTNMPQVDWSKATESPSRKGNQTYQKVIIESLSDNALKYVKLGTLRVDNGNIVVIRVKPKTEAEKLENKAKRKETVAKIHELKSKFKDKLKLAQKSYNEDADRTKKSRTDKNPSLLVSLEEAEANWEAIKSCRNLEDLKLKISKL